jgi:hypothetical protein
VEAMANLKMILYTAYDGIESTITWDSEEVYQLIKQFLENMGLDVSETLSDGVRTRPAFVYMETEQQYDALCDFTRALKDEGKIQVA